MRSVHLPEVPFIQQWHDGVHVQEKLLNELIQYGLGWHAKAALQV